MIDWGFFKKNIKFNAALARSVDRGVLPYSLSTQSDALLKASTDLGFKAADIDASTKAAYVGSVRSLANAARKYDARRDNVKAAAVASTNQALLAIEKSLNSNLTALNVWDDTIYPFQQSMTDLEAMQAALDALEKTPIAYRDARQRARRRQLRLVRPLLQLPGLLHEPAAASAGLRARQHGRPRPHGDVRRRHPGEERRCAPPGPRRRCRRRRSTASRPRSRPSRPTSRAALETLTSVLNGATGQIKAITPKTR